MYLIDGYNLLYQTDLENSGELVAKLNQLCRAKNKRALIVFDGYSPEDLSSEVLEVRFSGNADLEISEIIKQNNNPTQLVLVSSDKDLIYNARQKGLNVLKSEQFSYLLNEGLNSGKNDDDKPTIKILSDKDVREELESFNYFKSNK
jgi:hypothetical protein